MPNARTPKLISRLYIRYFVLVWLIAVFPAASGAQASTTAAEAPTRREVTISYRCLPGKSVPLIELTLNGKTTATFMLDTGSNGSAISDALAKRVGVLPKPGVFPDGSPIMDQGEHLNTATFAPVNIGDSKSPISITSYPFVVFSDKRVQDVAGKGVDGLIGADLLRFMAVRLDCPRHQATFWFPGNLSAKEVVSSGFDQALVVPVTDPDSSMLYLVQGQFQNGLNVATEKMRVDTGSDGTLISASTAKTLKLVPDVRQEANLLRSTVVFLRAKVPSIRFGDLTLHDCPVYYSEKEDSTYPLSLGMDVLSSYRVLLDYAHGSMYLKPATPNKIKVQIKGQGQALPLP